ncbi:MAG TPA: XrtA system polysaccharide deacetylase [Bryobacteraceae bacterium]|nr:XrtA system polysaccharide deacetylase [Bryobacteraceae bacterium]
MNRQTAPISNALTIDVEEYFHPTEIQAFVDPSEWNTLLTRVEPEVHFLLDLLEQKGVSATFFILGWVADHRPGLVQMIADRGHEIGCHSYAHRLVYDLTPTQFRHDTMRAVATIADACGVTPRVYRAPSYSITRESLWALETLIECGFTHDSSIYPVTHDRYGIAGFKRHAHLLKTPSGAITEVPIATVKLANGRVAPIGGGGYLRMLPYRYTAAGIRRVNRDEQQPACIYFHPWEIDPYQPRLARGMIARLRTYTGLKAMRLKLERLLTEFSFSTLTAVYPQDAQAAASADRKPAGSMR